MTSHFYLLACHFSPEGSSSVILYVIRLALRVEAYCRFMLSPRAELIRGLSLTPAAQHALSRGAEELRAVSYDLSVISYEV